MKNGFPLSRRERVLSVAYCKNVSNSNKYIIKVFPYYPMWLFKEISYNLCLPKYYRRKKLFPVSRRHFVIVVPFLFL